METSVVNQAVGRKNNSMNLFLALFWLVCAVLLFVYEQYVGDSRFRIRIGTSSFSYIWPMLVLVLYNLKRWWSVRSYRAALRMQQATRTSREWRRRFHATEPSVSHDPKLNFTDESPSTDNPGITDSPQPPG